MTEYELLRSFAGSGALKIEVSGSAPDITKALDMVPRLNQFQVHDKVVRVMGKIIAGRAKELAPRSVRNPKRPDLKRSKKQRAQSDWGYPLWKSITYATRKTAKGGYAIVGPSWPKGNKAHFNTAHKKGYRDIVLWGKETGRFHLSIRNYLIQAADETKSEQIAAAKVEIDKFMKANFGG